ncbi:MAG TPA: UdgX family uracil-DNA binding protein [Tepidisphaeraceae bacterium]|jgi:DNA polymerase|nr:UdgX family uracil-DNA binding protein [Tepidisphaeraceae bacterium]
MVLKLAEFPTAEAFLPERITLPALKKAVQGCRGCPLYKNATQAVFGEGPQQARIMFIGEQPGDQEDLAGKPFVGPAGKILDKTLEEVGIERGDVYVTNAVKHFKFEPRGKRRIHSKPSTREMAACKPWLTAEIGAVKPKMVVALGATAAQDLFGKDFKITRERGKIFEDTQIAPMVMATIHPSAILRMPDHEARERARREFREDLEKVARRLR